MALKLGIDTDAEIARLTAALATSRAETAKYHDILTEKREYAAGWDAALAALAARDKATREQALREAADVTAYMPGSGKHKRIMTPWRDAILSIIK